jgi:hypothetical protein
MEVGDVCERFIVEPRSVFWEGKVLHTLSRGRAGRGAVGLGPVARLALPRCSISQPNQSCYLSRKLLAMSWH